MACPRAPGGGNLARENAGPRRRTRRESTGDRSIENYQIRWHRDLSYQHFVTSRSLAISALVCVDDFSHQTGGTVVLPATHKIPEYPSDAFVENNAVQIEAKSGSVLIMDAMVYHRAGRNISTNLRRGLNHVIGRSFLAQQIALPGLVDAALERSSFARYLGFPS